MRVYNPCKPSTILICGNSFFTGHYGSRYNPQALNGKDFYTLLSATIKQYLQANKKVSFTIVKDFIQPEYADVHVLENISWHSFTVDPCMQFSVNPDWVTFEDYLNDITSKYKKRFRAIAKKAEKLTVKEFSADDIAENIPRIDVLLQ